MVALVAGVIGWRKATRDSAGISDSNARLLRGDLAAVDESLRTERRRRVRLEKWIADHMRWFHDLIFDPSTLYEDDDET